MEDFVARVDLEYNGMLIDVVSVVPNARAVRARASTMTKNGTIRTRPEWGLSVVIRENENVAKNIDFTRVAGATITVVFESGRRRIYPNCVVLNASESGYNGTAPNDITYDVACDEPMEA